LFEGFGFDTRKIPSIQAPFSHRRNRRRRHGMRGHPDFDFLVRRQQQLSGSSFAVESRAYGPTRVLIAQSSRMLAEALMLAIDVEPWLEPIGYALDGWEALELIESLSPDVVVVGPNLNSLDSLTLTRLLNECWPNVRVLVLADAQAHDLVAQAHAAGAAGCLPVERSADELIDAIATASLRPLRLAECPQPEASVV
jgi:CheY-like chemotaxis protein